VTTVTPFFLWPVATSISVTFVMTTDWAVWLAEGWTGLVCGLANLEAVVRANNRRPASRHF
jgi:hypothetical protein